MSLSERLRAGLGLISLVSLGASFYAVVSSPAIYYNIGGQLRQCEACRIFYFHVPLAWVAFLAFFIVFLASILYLRTAQPQYDSIALSAAEVGVVFTTLVLVTGSIWARPVWGTWWSWDARLTTTLVLWFIYMGYLMLRSYISDERRAARFSAVVGIVGFLDVPIVYQSVVWWRTLHPGPTVFAEGGIALPPEMRWVFGLCMLAFTVLAVYLWLTRLEVARLRRWLAQDLSISPEAVV